MDLAGEFRSSIRADRIHYLDSIWSVPLPSWGRAVWVKPGLIAKLFNRTPRQMQSDRARPWTKEFFVAAQLWGKGISTQSF